MAIKLKMAYDNFDQASLETGLKCEDKSLAQQQFLEETNILTIVERFGLSGELPRVLNLPQAGDFTGIFDYQTAMNQLVATRQQFDSLPYKVRDRFNNDPQKFYEFCTTEENAEEAIRLGLATKPPVVVKPEPMEVRVVNPDPTPVKTP